MRQIAVPRATRPVAVATSDDVMAGTASRIAEAMREGRAHVEPLFLSSDELEAARADMLAVMAQITAGGDGPADGDFESIQTDLLNPNFRSQLAAAQQLPFAPLLERLDALRHALVGATGRSLIEGGGFHLMRYPIGSKFLRHVDEVRVCRADPRSDPHQLLARAA